MGLYSLHDAHHVYPIHEVGLRAGSPAHAAKRAAEAMMGAPLSDVDEKVVREFLESCWMEQVTNQGPNTVIPMPTPDEVLAIE